MRLARLVIVFAMFAMVGFGCEERKTQQPAPATQPSARTAQPAAPKTPPAVAPTTRPSTSPTTPR